LQKVYQFQAEKGVRQVSLMGQDGKQAGFASGKRLEVYMP